MPDRDQNKGDDQPDASNEGVSNTEPAEGADDSPGGNQGSPAAD